MLRHLAHTMRLANSIFEGQKLNSSLKSSPISDGCVFVCDSVGVSQEQYGNLYFTLLVG